jgi:hypothetical protein
LRADRRDELVPCRLRHGVDRAEAGKELVGVRRANAGEGEQQVARAPHGRPPGSDTRSGRDDPVELLEPFEIG